MITVRAFLMALYRTLGRRCFVSGTFVVAEPRGSPAFDALLRLLKTGSSRRFATTHADFRDSRAFAASRLRGPKGPPLQSSSPQMEYAVRPPLQDLCGGSTAIKRVLLWYRFKVAGQGYLFLKLESSSALSVSHAASAAARYLLKREKAADDGLQKRRENARKDRAGLNADAALRESRENVDTLWPHPEHRQQAEAYDRDVRVGRELFVPASVAARLAALA